MTYREFQAPAYEDFVEAFGTEPKAAADEPAAHTVEIVNGDDTLFLSYDIAGRSVRCQWDRKAYRLVDLYREGATRLAIESTHGTTHIVVAFETDSLAGELRIQVYPSVRFDDQLLYR